MVLGGVLSCYFVQFYDTFLYRYSELSIFFPVNCVNFQQGKEELNCEISLCQDIDDISTKIQTLLYLFYLVICR